MFTGIVQTMGRVAEARATAAGVRLVVDVGTWRPECGVRLGDSICVSGACLTVAEMAAGRLHFDVIPETLRLTTLGRLRAGARVNLEPSLTPTTPMGGHVLQGHVDGMGMLVRVQRDEREARLRVGLPAALMEFVVPKGSVALEGVSLTIASVQAASFEVALIPTTLAVTTLGAVKEGETLNVETDILTRTVVWWMKRSSTFGGAEVQGPKSKVQSPKSKIQNSESKVRGLRSQGRGARSKDAKPRAAERRGT